MQNPVREIRVENDMTRRELAVLAGVSVSYVARIELGDYEPNEAVLSTIERLGHSRAKVLSDFGEFRRAMEKKIKDKFQSKVREGGGNVG